MLILGLDASTSTVGISLINESTPLIIDAVELSSLNYSLYEKSDLITERLKTIANEYIYIDHIAIEEPLQVFSKGKSSAGTLSTLQQWNGMVQLISRQIWNVNPTLINCSHARKVCGIPINRASDKSAKQQTFEWIMGHDLMNHQFPQKLHKKSQKPLGRIVDWAADAVDAYVVAKTLRKETIQ